MILATTFGIFGIKQTSFYVSFELSVVESEKKKLQKMELFGNVALFLSGIGNYHRRKQKKISRAAKGSYKFTISQSIFWREER